MNRVTGPVRMNRSSWLPNVVFLAAALAAAPLCAQAPTTSPPAPAPAAAPTTPQTQPAQTPAAQQPAPASANGQQPQPGDDANPDAYKLVVRVNEVNLIFTVTDKKGRFITGLKRENFGLLDDGRPPVAVLRFSQQTNLPLRVGIMLDTSSSIRQRFQFEQDSAIEFLLQILHRNDRAFVEGFDIETDVTQGFTNNIDLLNQGIRKLRPGGGTALYDALYKTCRDQMLTLKEDGAVRRALIVVSDGDDNYSRAQQSDAIKMCQRAETIVYTISTNISPSKDKGDEVLRTISEATGGMPFFPTKIEDVAIGFRNIQEELRSQYSLVYRPADFKQDGAFRTIYLQALDQRYHVRASKGYFAPRATP
ncbi:VWA domain-containing protein [Edaphobacter aggregans]|uniref:VWA domain-containing protein n=1 Tax=Edaphobacter aggregans TaxID=570835 RepID=UPI001FE065D9|nr:VWA domain-containing protein [Edaphobacter aggregans]